MSEGGKETMREGRKKRSKKGMKQGRGKERRMEAFWPVCIIIIQILGALRRTRLQA